MSAMTPVAVSQTLVVSDPVCSTASFLTNTEDQCFCDCFEIDTNPVALNERIDDIKSNLTVDTQSLSSTRREKTSANDNRPSAVSVGFFGILILTALITSIIFQDISALAFFLVKGVVRKVKTGTFQEPPKARRKRKKKTETPVERPTKEDPENSVAIEVENINETPPVEPAEASSNTEISKEAALIGRPEIPPNIPEKAKEESKKKKTPFKKPIVKKKPLAKAGKQQKSQKSLKPSAPGQVKKVPSGINRPKKKPTVIKVKSVSPKKKA